MKNKFILLHAYSQQVEVSILPDRNCPDSQIYLLPQGNIVEGPENFAKLVESTSILSDRANFYRDRYGKLLSIYQGLKYKYKKVRK